MVEPFEDEENNEPDDDATAERFVDSALDSEEATTSVEPLTPPLTDTLLGNSLAEVVTLTAEPLSLADVLKEYVLLPSTAGDREADVVTDPDTKAELPELVDANIVDDTLTEPAELDSPLSEPEFIVDPLEEVFEVVA